MKIILHMGSHGGKFFSDMNNFVLTSTLKVIWDEFHHGCLHASSLLQYSMINHHGFTKGKSCQKLDHLPQQNSIICWHGKSSGYCLPGLQQNVWHCLPQPSPWQNGKVQTGWVACEMVLSLLQQWKWLGSWAACTRTLLAETEVWSSHSMLFRTGVLCPVLVPTIQKRHG